jgi:hypothetical protein
LADPQQLNSYSYADNNRITVEDPSGLITPTAAKVLGLYARVLNLLSQIVVQLGGGGSAGNPVPASTALLARSTTINPGSLTISQSNQGNYGNVLNQIKTSDDFQNYVTDQIKKKGQKGTIDISANDSQNSFAFKSGDLHTAFDKVNAGLLGTESANGTWNVHVNIKGTYNFEYNSFGSSYSGVAISTLNNAALVGQWTGVVSRYPVNNNFDYIYKSQ